MKWNKLNRIWRQLKSKNKAKRATQRKREKKMSPRFWPLNHRHSLTVASFFSLSLQKKTEREPLSRFNNAHWANSHFVSGKKKKKMNSRIKKQQARWVSESFFSILPDGAAAHLMSVRRRRRCRGWFFRPNLATPTNLTSLNVVGGSQHTHTNWLGIEWDWMRAQISKCCCCFRPQRKFCLPAR